ncbi:MAG TPA: hypothetical protein PLD12_01950 [Bacteroidales bacterium]|nr:hypothetical protein [Bacteroidales bacterium]HOK97879.1 hypothetical protein [Bacteroidales bacterium]HPO64644.1 hypothetical protein [Bacteroidales bacterium]
MQVYSLQIAWIVVSTFFLSCTRVPIELGKIENFRVERVTTESISCSMDVPITNHSIFPFTVEKGELSAYFENERIGSAHITEAVRIASWGTRTYPIKLHLMLENPEASTHMAVNALMGRRNTYFIRGTVNARSIIFQRKIAIEKTIVK